MKESRVTPKGGVQGEKGKRRGGRAAKGNA